MENTITNNKALVVRSLNKKALTFLLLCVTLGSYASMHATSSSYNYEQNNAGSTGQVVTPTKAERLKSFLYTWRYYLVVGTGLLVALISMASSQGYISFPKTWWGNPESGSGLL